MELSKEELIEGIMLNIEMPRYVYHFEDIIDIDSVQALIDLLSNHEAVDLYFTTMGGRIDSMEVLLHFLNNHPDIRVYLTGHIMSAGTLLLTDFKGQIIITRSLEAILFHLGDRAVEGEFRKTLLNRKIMHKQLKKFNNKLLKKYTKLGITEKEIEIIRKGEDIVLYRKDFHRLRINNNK